MHKLKFKNLFIVLVILIIIVYSIYSLKKESISKKMVCKDCNIVLIDIDCLRADHLGCYGYPKNTSLNIDKFAKDSILFKKFFSESSLTLPSRMSVYSSLYPYVHGIKHLARTNENKEKATKLNSLMLPKILSKNNYSNVLIVPSEEIAAIHSNLGEEFEYISESKYNQLFDWKDNYWYDGLEWIKNNKDKKFFVSFFSSRVHEPYAPKEENLYKFINRTDIKPLSYNELEEILIEKIINKPNKLLKYDFVKNNPKLFSNKTLLINSFKDEYSNDSIQHLGWDLSIDEEFFSRFKRGNSYDWDLIMAFYDSEVYEADQEFNKIIETLKREELLNKTIIILYSDHGDEFGEHGDYSHGEHLYDESIHAPLIIFIPGMESKEINALAQGVDIIPTILDLVGIKTSKQAQGKSLLPIIKDEKEDIRKYAFSEGLSNLFSIRSKEWKYITNFKGNEELYNLKQDPGEKENLISTEPEIAYKMKEKLKEHLKTFENISVNKKRLNTKIAKKVLIILIFLLIVIVILPKKYFKIKVMK